MYYSLFILSFLTTFILISFLSKYSKQLKFIDYPNKRKNHKYPISSIGGLCILIIFSTITYIMFKYQYVDSYPLEFIITKKNLLISTFLIFLLGISDDIFKINSLFKFLIQILALCTLIYDLKIDGIFFYNYYLDIFIYLILSLIILNTFNLLDGLDNLTALTGILILFFFNVLFFITNINYSIILFSIVLISSLTAFIMYNIFISRMFLGDTGSLFIGWIFVILTTTFVFEQKIENAIYFPISIFSIPFFDVILVAIKRFTNEKKHTKKVFAIFNPDHIHLHHLFIKHKYSKIKIILFYTINISFFSILTLLIINKINLIFYLLIMELLFVFYLRLILLKKNNILN